MKIEILGTGCKKCKKLYDNVLKAMEEIGLSCEVLKIEDPQEITNYGVLRTPALVVDGKIVASGKVLKPKEIIEYIK